MLARVLGAPDPRAGDSTSAGCRKPLILADKSGRSLRRRHERIRLMSVPSITKATATAPHPSLKSRALIQSMIDLHTFGRHTGPSGSWVVRA